MTERNVGVNPDLFRRIRTSSSPGMEPEVVEKILRGYFSGKRDSIRTYKFLNLEVAGQHGTFKAVAVDISRSGMLMRVMDPHFATPAEMGCLMPYTARVWYHFEGGFRARFLDSRLAVRAMVVRVTGYCGRGNSLILCGCRFERPLTHEECARLDIEYADDRPPG